MSKNKFEQLIEYIINEDEAKAKALFHQIVVEKSRDIYEGLQSQELGGQRLGKQIEGHEDVIDGDEIGEADDEFGDEEGLEGGDAIDIEGSMDQEGAEEFADNFPGGEEGEVEFGGDDEGGDLDTRVMDLEDAIDELKAEFDQLMGAEEEEGHDFGGDGEDMGGDDEFGGDEGESDFDSEEGEGTDELGDEAEGDGDMKFGEASIYGGEGNSKTMREGKDAKKDAADKKKADAKKADDKKKADKKKTDEGKSPAELMREYVEKVGQNWPNGATEGDEVGAAGKKQPINSKSNVISGKNDMGGTTKNIAQGGTAGDKDSNTGPKKPSNLYTKGETKMGQDKYENSPAANTKGYKDKQQAKTKEGSTTGSESAPVVKKSFNPGGKPGFKG